MATYGANDYTTVKALNMRGSGGIRVGGFDGGGAGTLYLGATTNEGARAWGFPDKSGTFGISGSFTVNLPAISANGYLSTTVTGLTNVRAEDALIIVPQTGSGVAVASARGAVVITEVQPQNGGAILLFWNITGTATIPQTNAYAFTAVR